MCDIVHWCNRMLEDASLRFSALNVCPFTSMSIMATKSSVQARLRCVVIAMAEISKAGWTFWEFWKSCHSFVVFLTTSEPYQSAQKATSFLFARAMLGKQQPLLPNLA